MARYACASLIFAVAFVVGCDRTRPKPAAPELTDREQAIVGDWLAQFAFTKNDLDEYHETYPEGDRELVEKSWNKFSRTPMFSVRFNADKSFAFLTKDGKPVSPPADISIWELSKDGRTVTVTMQTKYSSQTSKVVNGKNMLTEESVVSSIPMVYTLSEDGLSIVALGENQPHTRYLKAGSEAANKAFTPEPKPISPFELAPTAAVEDYVGTWTGRLTMPQEAWEGFRTYMSEEEANKEKERMETLITLILNKDMTYAVIEEGQKAHGTWGLKNRGPGVLLDGDKQSEVSPPPEELGLSLRLTRDKGLVVPYDPISGRTGPWKLTRKRG